MIGVAVENADNVEILGGRGQFDLEHILVMDEKAVALLLLVFPTIGHWKDSYGHIFPILGPAQ